MPGAPRVGKRRPFTFRDVSPHRDDVHGNEWVTATADPAGTLEDAE